MIRRRNYQRRDQWQRLAEKAGFTGIRDLLQEYYVVLDYSMRDIADRLGYSEFAIRKQLIRHGIPIRRQGRKERERETLNTQRSDRG